MEGRRRLNEGLKGAKTIGLCQETLDVQSLPMLVTTAEQRFSSEWMEDWGVGWGWGFQAGTGRGGMFRANVYL